MADSASATVSSTAEASAVKSYLNDLHDRITAAVENVDAAKFHRDAWQRPEGGGGESRILGEGTVFERAGLGIESSPRNRRRAIRSHGPVPGVSSQKSLRAHDSL